MAEALNNLGNALRVTGDAEGAIRASVRIDTLDIGSVGNGAETWEHAVRKLRGRLMPPPGSTQPTQAEIDRFVAFLEGRAGKVLKSS